MQKEKKQFKIDYHAELNSEQLKAVTAGDGPSLVLAGAGSGKTRTLVYRVAYLIEKGVQPQRIMLLTFTKKAAREMLDRVELLLGAQAKNVWGGTFHHLGNRLLKKYAKAIGLNPNYTILDSEDSINLIKSIIGELNLPKNKRFPNAKTLRNIISSASNEGKNIQEIFWQKYNYLDPGYLEQIKQINQTYQSKKQNINALDFDDLLIKWLHLLNQPLIQQKITSVFGYLLVDEFQDTNYLQNEIIKKMATKQQNILVVGDDSQSIYSFRGATVKNILDFPQSFKNCQIYRLETNYRSSPEILELANQSIANNANQFQKKLKTAQASYMLPNLVSLDDGRHQAEYIADKIIQAEKENGIPLNQMAVLFRSHYQSIELELELNKKNIPYEMRGGLRFFEQAHIKDITAFLKILHNHRDEIAWQRILTNQPGIGPARASKVFQSIVGLDSLSQLAEFDFSSLLNKNALEGFQSIKNIFIDLINLENKSVSHYIDYILEKHYRKYIKNNYDNAEERVEDLKSMMQFSQKYKSLNNFLSDVALAEGFRAQASSSANNETEAEKLILSTIHQAKGLEWHTVFLIGLVDGQFPHNKVFNEPAELEEERRLFYVALTRAKKELYLTYPLFSSNFGDFGRISQFIRELPEELFNIDEVENTEDDFESVFL